MKYILGYKRDTNGNMVMNENCRLNIKEMFEYAKNKANSYVDVRREFGVYYHTINIKDIESVNKEILNNSNDFDLINKKYGIMKTDFDYIVQHKGKQPPFSLNTLTDVRRILMNKKYCGDENLPSIISESLFDAVQTKISTFKKNNSSQFILAGLSKCCECGLALRYKEYRPKDEENKRYTAYRIVCSQNNVKNRADRPSHIDRKCNFKEDIDAFDLENEVLRKVLESKRILADEEQKLIDYCEKISKKNWDDIINKENLEFTRTCRNILSKYIKRIIVKNLDEIQIDYKNDISVTSEIIVNCHISTASNTYIEEQDDLIFA